MKSKNIVYCMLLLFVLKNYTTSAQTWSPPMRVVNPNIGTGAVIGFSIQHLIVNGNPAMAYRDQTHSDLVFVRANDPEGNTWGTPITLDIGASTGDLLSFKIINGNPAIAYIGYAPGKGINRLKYVRATDASGTMWGQPVVVKDDQCTGVSMLTINGVPNIAFRLGIHNLFKYVSALDASGSNWDTTVNMPVNNTGLNETLVALSGIPFIIFISSFNSAVSYIRATDATGTRWGTPVFIDSAIGGDSYSVKIVNGNPAIAFYAAFYDTTTKTYKTGLRFIRAADANGTSWGSPANLPVNLDFNNVGHFPSLQIVNGKPAVSYYDQANKYLKYVSANDEFGTAWGTPVTVDQEGYVGSWSSLQEVNGMPAIAYYAEITNKLKYVRATEAPGTAWATPLTFDFEGAVGTYTSLQLVNGVPAISFYDQTKNRLRYVTATSEAGNSWNAPVTAAAVGGKYTSLQVVNGRPAISYHDDNTNSLKYVRSSDALGATWGTPFSIDAFGGQYISMQIVGGNPAISYYDLANRLKYVRANNIDGTSWGTPVIIDVAAGLYTSLKVVNGNPAISYYNISNGDLKYVRASDPNGTLWGTPIIVDAFGNTGKHTSLQIVDGNPAISYTGTSYYPDSLKYIRSTDVSGNNWSAPSITLDDAQTGARTSLQVVNGKPAIAYAEDAIIPAYLSGGNLKYVFSTDPSGNAWGIPSNVVIGCHPEDISMVNTASGAAIAYYNVPEALPYFIPGTGESNGTLITDYFRSRQNGSFNDASVWESSPVQDFSVGVISPATLTPTINSKMITIRNGHVVTITADITLHSVLVDMGSSLNVAQSVNVTTIP